MQKECLSCGEIEELVDAVDKEKIVEICRSCARKNNFPIIRKPTVEQIRNESRFRSVGERIRDISEVSKHSSSKPSEEDRELEEIVAKNIKKREYEDLIDNFHWHVQHARRLKKISARQLGEAIAEPEIIITMAEKGDLPDEYERVVAKLEQFLDIKLFNEKSGYSQRGFSYEGGFDIRKANLFEVKIKDLKEIAEIDKLKKARKGVGEGSREEVGEESREEESSGDDEVEEDFEDETEDEEEIPAKKQGIFGKMFGKRDVKIDEGGNLVDE